MHAAQILSRVTLGGAGSVAVTSALLSAGGFRTVMCEVYRRRVAQYSAYAATVASRAALQF